LAALASGTSTAAGTPVRSDHQGTRTGTNEVLRTCVLAFYEGRKFDSTVSDDLSLVLFLDLDQSTAARIALASASSRSKVAKQMEVTRDAFVLDLKG
jgi:hypothetical protein